MTLSKETLSKTIEVLKEELKMQEEFTQSKVQEMKNFTYGNFVYYDCSCFSYTDLGYARVLFHHVNDRDVDLAINTNSEFADEWSWSSWSYSRKKEEESKNDLEKSEAYLSKTVEKIQILKNEYRQIREVAIAAVEFYINTIQPEYKKEYAIERQIKELEEQTKNIDKDNELAEAKKIFTAGTKHYFYNDVYINNSNSSRYFRIEEKGKGLVFYTYDYEDSRARKLTDEFILDLYKASKKVATDSRSNYDEEDNYSPSYYKTSNYISEECYKDYSKIEWAEITKDEFKELKRQY